MAIMAAFEMFLAEEAAAAATAEAVGSTLAADALAATALTAGEMAGLGATVGEGATAAQGITQASMAADAAAGGAGAGQAGINAAQVGTQQGAATQIANSGLPPGFDQQLQNIQNMSQGPSVQVASANPSAGLDSLKNAAYNGPVTSPVSGFTPDPSFQGITSGSQGASPGFFNATQAPGQGPLQYQLSAPSTAGQGIRLGTGLEGITAPTTPMTSVMQPPSALENGFNTAAKFAKENPFTAMTGAYMGANALGLLSPTGATFNDKKYDGPLTKYRLSDDFQAGSANPQDFQYTPKRYAEGGIMGTSPYSIPVGYDEGGQMPEPQGYAKGGSLSDSIDSYQKLLSGKPMEAPSVSRDVGIYYDQDPDTRYQDALTAAQIRQAKVNQRAYVSPPVAKRPTPMGQLQMASVKPRKQGSDDVEAAHGGIMHSSLGGYAAGGNPRLLKGPGDGMSDNIPATINGRQPARLADGEFVIPADVVSHLGNGSTEAGAKQLHAMMNKVRSARTGNSKQGKQIKPQKYMPK
jgi:hypothetical protein